MQQATGQEKTAPLLPGISKHKHTDVLLGVRTIQFTAITCVIMKTEVLNSKIQQTWLVPGDSEVTSKW